MVIIFEFEYQKYQHGDILAIFVFCTGQWANSWLSRIELTQPTDGPFLGVTSKQFRKDSAETQPFLTNLEQGKGKL
jgi:hypothetical protein